MQLAHRHVLVTGASRGIGASLAAQAAARGADVTLVARSAVELEAAAGRLGRRALPCDLAVPAERAGLVERAEAAAGRPVDVLINCAGLDMAAGLLAIEGDALEQLFQVNLLAPAELARQVLPGMVERRRGHVVDVSSGFAAVSCPGLVPYAASKAGLSHFHAGLRLELRGTGIGTTLVEPGPVRTAMYDAIEGERLSSAAIRRLLRLRLTALSEPEQVAAQTLDAVESGRRHVVPARRMAPVMALTWLPRRAGDLLMSGVPRR